MATGRWDLSRTAFWLVALPEIALIPVIVLAVLISGPDAMAVLVALALLVVYPLVVWAVVRIRGPGRDARP